MYVCMYYVNMILTTNGHTVTLCMYCMYVYTFAGCDHGCALSTIHWRNEGVLVLLRRQLQLPRTSDI